MVREDPVNEVRRVRDAHAAEYDYDLDRIVEDIQSKEALLIKNGWNVVTRKKKPNHTVEVKSLNRCSSF